MKKNKFISKDGYAKDVILLEIFFFFLCSCTGFVWEVILMYIENGRYIKRGFFYGPWLPVYGVGGVLFHLLLKRFAHSRCTVFFFSALLGSLVELAIGWFIDTFWGLRYWDYSGYPFDFHGYICLAFALVFGLSGMLWICFLSDRCEKLWLRFPIKKRRNLNTILLLLFVFDCVAALIFPNMGDGITFP